MKRLEKLFESRKHKRERLEEYQNYKEFCELMENRVGQHVYFHDADDYHRFYISSRLLEEYGEYTVDSLYCVDVSGFPNNIDTHCHFYMTFKKIMEMSPYFIYEEEVDKLKEEYIKKEQDRKKEIAGMIKATLYHNITKSPGDKNYLLDIQRVYECNGLYYIDTIVSDLHHKNAEKVTYEVGEWFVKWYEEGDGVKIIDARKAND